jgi:gas vesicle protein
MGILSGSLVGAAAVMLLTPQSGSDLRRSVAEKYRDIVESGREAMMEQRQALETEYKRHIQIPLNPPEKPSP